MNRETVLILTLLALAVAAIAGLCFAPLLFRPCGHRCSLVDHWHSKSEFHICGAAKMRRDLSFFDGFLEDCVPEEVGTYDSIEGGHQFVGTFMKHQDHWQVSVARDKGLPGWYLLTTDGKVHFSERGPATAQDAVLPD